MVFFSFKFWLDARGKKVGESRVLKGILSLKRVNFIEFKMFCQDTDRMRHGLSL